MRAMIRGGVILALAGLLGLLWLATARRLSEWVDAVATAPVAELSPSPFWWNDVWLQFGPPQGDIRENLVGRTSEIDPQFRRLDLTGPGPLYGSAAKLTVEADGRLVLFAQGKKFVLGVLKGNRPPADADDPTMQEFAAEPGDSASLVIERSLLPWPTPFEMNVVGMGGTATIWRRNVYYRLSWTKASGARLAMLWAGEQPYDGANLWRAPGASLTQVEIRTAP